MLIPTSRGILLTHNVTRGLLLESPGNFSALKDICIKCIPLKLLVWREALFILITYEQSFPPNKKFY